MSVVLDTQLPNMTVLTPRRGPVLSIHIRKNAFSVPGDTSLSDSEWSMVIAE